MFHLFYENKKRESKIKHRTKRKEKKEKIISFDPDLSVFFVSIFILKISFFFFFPYITFKKKRSFIFQQKKKQPQHSFKLTPFATAERIRPTTTTQEDGKNNNEKSNAFDEERSLSILNRLTTAYTKQSKALWSNETMQHLLESSIRSSLLH